MHFYKTGGIIMYKPAFCINKKCKYHKRKIETKHWYIKYGKYETLINGQIQRYKCKNCRTTFSRQTYHINYYIKKNINYRKIMELLSGSMNLRALSRVFKASVDSISNRIERLARQLLVYHEYLKSTIKLKEDLVADGFESFAVSQYFPNNIHLLGGKESQYLYDLNYVLLKRKGKMTDYQKKKRKKLYKKVVFHKGALSKSFREIVDEVFHLAKTSEKEIKLYTDMKPEYRTVFKKHELSDTGKVSHIRILSRKHRTVKDFLFTCDYLDREIRKDQAAHRRETKCFSRNVCNSMNRLIVYFFYHNYIKDYRVHRVLYRNISHAEVAGVPKAKIKEVLKKNFTDRVFYSMEKLKTFASELWSKKIVTSLKKKAEYIPRYALM